MLRLHISIVPRQNRNQPPGARELSETRAAATCIDGGLRMTAERFLNIFICDSLRNERISAATDSARSCRLFRRSAALSFLNASLPSTRARSLRASR